MSITAYGGHNRDTYMTPSIEPPTPGISIFDEGLDEVAFPEPFPLNPVGKRYFDCQNFPPIKST
jgi:hypothetical protein